MSGIGPLTAKNLDGRGVRVIVVGERGKDGAKLFDCASVKYEDWWGKSWSPSLVRTRLGRERPFNCTLITLIVPVSDGTIHLDVPFSRLLGKPPIMVAGMTPTVKAGFVSAALDAGFHIKLASGGHYNATALRAKVSEIQKKIPAGVGITLNSLYINPRQFNFQFTPMARNA